MYHGTAVPNRISLVVLPLQLQPSHARTHSLSCQSCQSCRFVTLSLRHFLTSSVLHGGESLPPCLFRSVLESFLGSFIIAPPPPSSLDPSGNLYDGIFRLYNCVEYASSTLSMSLLLSPPKTTLIRPSCIRDRNTRPISTHQQPYGRGPRRRPACVRRRPILNVAGEFIVVFVP